MKKSFLIMLKLSFLLLPCMLLITSCGDAIEIEETTSSITNENSFTLSASMPDDDAIATRSVASQISGSKNIELKWKDGDSIQLYFKTGKSVVQGDKVPIKNISTDAKKGEFDVNVPKDVADTYDIYGVHGVNSKIIEGVLYLDARPTKMMPLSDIQIPIYFKLSNNSKDKKIENVTFKHYGALQLVTFKNSANKKIALKAPDIVSTESNKWYYDIESGNTTKQPVFNIESGEISSIQAYFSTIADIPLVDINQSDNLKLAQWIVPYTTTPPDINFKTYIDDSSITTVSPKSGRSKPIEVGNAYHLYTLWNGNELSFSDEITVQAYKITMTTTNSFNNQSEFYIEADAADQDDVWFDLNGNGQKEDGEAVKTFDDYANYAIKSTNITLYGKVTVLNCYNTTLTSINSSRSPYLTKLNCSDNDFLTLVDVRDCNTLNVLNCSNNNSLSSIYVTGVTALTNLICSNNISLTSLDVTDCKELKSLYFYNNHSLTSLDASGLTNLTSLNCIENNALTSINADGCISLNEFTCLQNGSLISLTLAGSTAIKYINCYSNNSLTSVDVSGCTSLINLSIKNIPSLTSLNVTGCSALNKLDCNDNNLTSLDLTGCISLTNLNCYSNSLTSLDVTPCPFLNELDCSSNNFKELNLMGSTELINLDFNFNDSLTSVNVSRCKSLKLLRWSNNKSLTSIIASGCTALTQLYYSESKPFTLLDLSGCSALTELVCSKNELKSLDVTGCTSLTQLDCSKNKLSSLDISSCTKLTFLDCSSNELTSINISGCTALNYLRCYSNAISGGAMDKLIDNLPNWSPSLLGNIEIIKRDGSPEGNICTVAQVERANKKRWHVYDSNYKYYPGS